MRKLLVALYLTAAALFATDAVAGDVGGNVYSSPGTITLRLEWGNTFGNWKEITKIGDGPYKFGVNIRNNTKYRVIGKSAPAGWACRGKMIEKYLTSAGATKTHVYCGSSDSAGVRVTTWNLEWLGAEASVNGLSASQIDTKWKAIASLLHQYNFDVIHTNEVCRTVDPSGEYCQQTFDQFFKNYFLAAAANPSDWDYRINISGCSQQMATIWRKSAVTLESSYELNKANSNGYIDETTPTWDDCGGRRPLVSTFTINGTTKTFTTATIHFKAYTTTTDCQLRKDQVDSFVQWVDWAGMGAKNFVALGDYNDQLPGAGNCSSIDTLASMESHSSFKFATAQPDYYYSNMMGNGLVTYDTNSFQNTIDHIWVSNSLYDMLEATTDTYANRANAVQANMYYSAHEEPDHNPPYIVIQK